MSYGYYLNIYLLLAFHQLNSIVEDFLDCYLKFGQHSQTCLRDTKVQLKLSVLIYLTKIIYTF